MRQLGSLRRMLSLAAAQIASFIIRPWRAERFNYSPEEWRQMRISFADTGEDLCVKQLLDRTVSGKRGIYVDAGAFDPVLISTDLCITD